jgi:N,N-dimethylformamidase
MALGAAGDELIGYTDRWSAAPGEVVALHASATADEVALDLVRVRHGDPNPEGPGLRVETVPSELAGNYQVAEQPIRAGSYAVLSAADVGAPAASLSIWAWTLRPAAGHPQTLVVRGDVGIFLDPAGIPAARIGDTVIIADAPLQRECWHDV